MVMWRAVTLFGIGILLITALVVFAQGDAPLGAAGNLLRNPGMEEGESSQPTGWLAVALPGGNGVIRFDWSDTRSNHGARSLGMSIEGTKRGLWQQIVPVEGDRIYRMTGYLATEGIGPEGDAHLQVVFRSADGTVLEFVDYSGHDRTRDFALDFPADLKFRAPDGAVRAEVNGYLQGPGSVWFDDFVFAAAPIGAISGRVTNGDDAVEGVRVWIHGDPWGKAVETTTGPDGAYVLADVPVAFPRYIVLAAKDGYKTLPQGDIAVAANATTTLDFALEPGLDPLDDLEVRYGFLNWAEPQERRDVPTDAVIPADRSGYPDTVCAFLEPDQYITSDHPAIQALAAELLESVREEDRHKTYDVAWAVYAWVSSNKNHDAVFGNGSDAYRDVTSGIWQTIQGGGWCWGRSFYDWAYKAHESLKQGSFICVEHSWLCAALLRALNIPARARVGSAQFWVQTAADDGCWVGMSTNGGSNTYRQHGVLGEGFGGATEPVFTPVTSEAFLHEDWNLENPGLWRETHPWGEIYIGTNTGLARAIADLERFAETGEAARGNGRKLADAGVYEIHYSAITINLYTVADQRLLDVRFPMATESEYYTDTGERAFWTNHPECAARTWVEEITNPPVEGTQRWFHIEFDLESLLPG